MRTFLAEHLPQTPPWLRLSSLRRGFLAAVRGPRDIFVSASRAPRGSLILPSARPPRMRPCPIVMSDIPGTPSVGRGSDPCLTFRQPSGSIGSPVPLERLLGKNRRRRAVPRACETASGWSRTSRCRGGASACGAIYRETALRLAYAGTRRRSRLRAPGTGSGLCLLLCFLLVALRARDPRAGPGRERASITHSSLLLHLRDEEVGREACRPVRGTRRERPPPYRPGRGLGPQARRFSARQARQDSTAPHEQQESRKAHLREHLQVGVVGHLRRALEKTRSARCSVPRLQGVVAGRRPGSLPTPTARVSGWGAHHPQGRVFQMSDRPRANRWPW